MSLFLGYTTNFLFKAQTPFDKASLNAELKKENITTNQATIDFIEENIELGTITHYINLKNFVVFLVTFDLFIICAFGFIHTLIDKVFIKKYYEGPDWQIALRRGMIIAIALDSLVLLRLFAGLTWFTFIPIVLLSILIEYYLTARKIKPTDENVESPNSSSD